MGQRHRALPGTAVAFSILGQHIDFAKLLLKRSIRLTQLGCPVRSRCAVTAVQPSLLGTIAIEIDGEQSSNDDSFSRKIQIRSVLEILVFAIRSPPFEERLAAEKATRTNTSRITRPARTRSDRNGGDLLRREHVGNESATRG
jgi:hypothetical protein